ncbi:hypothetical protein BDZ45DRAFT_741825 [Acephala macrosclerotiorum]|nr:hypothetical protein BDZ45DRAFT_741825 [Acephala macrosclerotiorum]
MLLAAYMKETKAIYIGQALDLHWTYYPKAPTEKEYFHSIDRKTGGLLRLMAKLIQACSTDLASLTSPAEKSTEDSKSVRLLHLIVIIGRYYQICDDLKDIKDAKNKQMHGFSGTLKTLKAQC